MENIAMRRVIRRTGLLLGAAALLVLALACNKGSGSTSSATLNNTHGTYHTTNWRAVHPGAALENLNSCIACHELTGLRSSACRHVRLRPSANFRGRAASPRRTDPR